VSFKRLLATVVAVAAASFAFASPASAQTQEGLVNVAVQDVVVQLPISVAANVCDVNVAVLAEIADDAGACEATADSAASAGPSGNGPPASQSGLVNVLVEDVVVQVPIALAANVCDVNVAVLAEIADSAQACEAQADSSAQAPGGGGGGQNASAAAFDPIQLVLDINGQVVGFLDPVTGNQVAAGSLDNVTGDQDAALIAQGVTGPIVGPGTTKKNL
jgi:hypothetical protein